MKFFRHRLCAPGCLLFCLGMFLTSFDAFSQDSATLVSVTISNGTQVMPRSMFTQTWTLKNTGTTTWTSGQSGYTLNLQGLDSLGATPNFTNQYPSAYSL